MTAYDIPLSTFCTNANNRWTLSKPPRAVWFAGVDRPPPPPSPAPQINLLFLCLSIYLFRSFRSEWMCVSLSLSLIHAREPKTGGPFESVLAPHTYIHTYIHTRARARTHTHKHTHTDFKCLGDEEGLYVVVAQSSSPKRSQKRFFYDMADRTVEWEEASFRFISSFFFFFLEVAKRRDAVFDKGSIRDHPSRKTNPPSPGPLFAWPDSVFVANYLLRSCKSYFVIPLLWLFLFSHCHSRGVYKFRRDTLLYACSIHRRD